MSDDHEEALAVFADGVCRLLKFEELIYPDERMAGSKGSCGSKPDQRTTHSGRELPCAESLVTPAVAADVAVIFIAPAGRLLSAKPDFPAVSSPNGIRKLAVTDWQLVPKTANGLKAL